MGFFKKFKDAVVAGSKAGWNITRGNQQPQDWLNTEKPEGLSMLIGGSTGELASRGHADGLSPNQCVWLANNDCCQNIVVMGGIGAGKTTRVINPLLNQLLNYIDVGGLIFDIKGDFCETVFKLAQANNNDRIVRIGVGEGCVGTNLLAGLSPQQSAGFLQSALILCGGGSGTGDSFWQQSATAVIENTLGLLSFCPAEFYTLEWVYKYIYFEDVRADIDEIIRMNNIDLDMSSNEGRKLTTYQSYYNNVFMTQDVKLRESIKATIANVLQPFQEPELIDAFSGEGFDLTNILAGAVVLVDLPLPKWTTAGKVIYTLIKLRFFNLLQERQVDHSLPQNYVFFMCDEYQNIISASQQGLSDLSFWDKSRSANCVGIISTQSVSSFRSAIGNREICDTVLSNFRQKIFFRTEDEQTLDLMNKIAGRVEVTRYSHNYSSGHSSRNIDLITQTNTKNYSFNAQIVERQLIDANLVRHLDQNHVIALLNIEGSACDDVLLVEPLYT